MNSEAPPLSLPMLALFEVVLSVSLFVPPIRYRGCLLFSLLLGLYVCIVGSSTGNQSTDWALGLSTTTQMGKAFYLLLLVDAEKELRRKHERRLDPTQFPFWRRLCWSFELVHTPRGVGWNWETPYICYSATASRG